MRNTAEINISKSARHRVGKNGKTDVNNFSASDVAQIRICDGNYKVDL